MSRGYAEPGRPNMPSGGDAGPFANPASWDVKQEDRQQPACQNSAASFPRLFIVSDIRLLCDGLTLALSQQATVSVLGSADLSISSGHLADLGPDVLLLDIGSPGALPACRRFRQALPRIKIVAIAVAEIEQDVIACAEAGISGFVPRQGNALDVVAAVQSAVRGEFVCSPRMTALLLNSITTLSNKSGESDVATLTGREQEIISLINEGLSNKEIARVLRIQNATVKNHVHSILGKLRVRRRGEAAAQLRKIHPPHSAGSAFPR